MKFLVFIKQVPESSEIHFDPARKTLKRDGVKNIINPYDRRAISEAVRKRNESGGEVIVATMGPPQAKESLAEALAMGADRAVHIQDSRLAGSDTLVTAQVLAAAAKQIGFDILFCGQSSTDSETGQVGPELAELLEVPCATAVRKLEYEEKRVRVSCETDDGVTVLDLPIPCVLAAAERLIKPIKVKDVDLTTYAGDRIEQLSLDDLKIDPGKVGLAGSPTWVDSISEQRIARRPEIWEDSDSLKTAARIIEMISRRAQPKQLTPTAENPSPGDKQFWCFIESSQERIRPVSYEMLSHAAEMAAKANGAVCAIVIGSPLNSGEVLQLSSFGADKIYHFTSTIFHPDEIVSVLCERIVAQAPFAFFIPATSLGKYLAPRVAARLQLGLTGDCVGLKIDGQGRLVQMKPAFGGNIIAAIYSRTFPQMATIRPGSLETRGPRTAKKIPVLAWPPPKSGAHRFEIVSRELDAGVDAEKMDEAAFIVCIGAGLGQENVPLAFQLAELMHGAVGATRKVVDQGWVQRQFQIGLTGRFVSPHAYLGLGVSGRYNHTIGIQRAGTIVSINQDPNAEILKISDVGVVGNCVDLAQKMIEHLRHKG